jgi:hypothetical protein
LSRFAHNSGFFPSIFKDLADGLKLTPVRGGPFQRLFKGLPKPDIIALLESKMPGK